MAAYSADKILALIDDIISCSQELNLVVTRQPTKVSTIAELKHDLVAKLANLNALNPHVLLTSFIENPDQPDLHKKLTHFLREEFVGIQPEKASREEITADYVQSKQSTENTVDSHNLNQLLKNQRKAVAELTQINQLRAALKNGVETTIRTNLQDVISADQIEALLTNRSTQAELDKIISTLSINPHQDLNSLSHAVAQNLLHTQDRRLNVLIQLADQSRQGDILQQNLTDSVNQNPEAAQAIPLIQGKDSNEILKSLKEASLLDAAHHNKPLLKEQLSSLLTQEGITDNTAITAIEAELLTHNTFTPETATAILQKQLGSTFSGLSPGTQTRLAEAVVVNFEIAGTNQNIAKLRVTLATNNIAANQVGNHASEIITESYNDRRSLPSQPLSLQDLKTVNQIIKNPKVLNDPQFFKKFVWGQSSPPSSFVQRWQSVISPQATPHPNFFQTIRSWFSSVSSRVQISFRNFADSVGSFFKGSGGGSGVGNFLKSGAKTLGNGLRSVGKALGQGAKALGKGLLNGARALGSKLGAAIATAAPEVVVIIVAVILIIAIVFMIAGASPNKTVMSQIDYVGGKGGNTTQDGGGGFCDPAIDSQCVPLTCEGSCLCPVKGYITQGPGGSFSHVGVNAIDIGLTNGDAVYSISDGTVAFAGWSTAGYGNLVIINNTDGTQLYYAHLETYFVTVGQTIKAKEQIGNGDDTGNSTGPHLHLEYRGTNTQNILGLFGFTAAEKATLNGCDDVSSCGGIMCSK